MTDRPNASLDRRRLLQGSATLGGLGMLGLGGCATAGGSPMLMAGPAVYPIKAKRDRIFDVTVCLRPFRAAGPRLDTEMVGDALVVHNYGHGGSGWSLSWGSSTIAVQKAMAGGPKEVAVLGCGALGLTSATLAQRAGAKVTIYAREMLPQARSARATGSWTPDSRIALKEPAGPGFAALWEQMARASFKTYRTYLGLPGDPVVWNDRYSVSEYEPGSAQAPPKPADPLGFGEYHESIADLTPKRERLMGPDAPWDAPFVYRSSSMMFNLFSYGHTLLGDFFAAGGRFERMEFASPAQLAQLKEKVVINCPGYGGRVLWKDESITPVRGQISWLAPQSEVNYGVQYKSLSILSRTDGILLQAVEGGDMKGYKDDNETPDAGETDRSVSIAQELYGRFKGRRA